MDKHSRGSVMEGINDIFQFIEIPPIEYGAVFDPKTGQVLSIGPILAFANKTNKIPVERELAIQILENKIKLTSCFVDVHSNKLEIAEIKSLYKIDDILHRIIDKHWSTEAEFDVEVLYNRSQKMLKFKLSESFRNAGRPIFWDGETSMDFLITAYNDPNMIYKFVSFKVADLSSADIDISNIDIEDTFSVYTRRLFKSYVFEAI
jgi:hypothetical protein